MHVPIDTVPIGTIFNRVNRANKNLCARCVQASNVARSLCDCTVPRCADCAAVTSEKDLSWEGVVEGRDLWLCASCSECRADEAAIETAREIGEAAE